VTAETVLVQAKPFDHSQVRREAHAGDVMRVMGETAGMEGDGKSWWATTDGYVPRETLQPADEAISSAWTIPSAEEAPNGWWGDVVERARVRVTAALDAPVVGFLEPGDRVKVLREQEGEPIDGDSKWFRVDGGRYAGGVVHGSTIARVADPAVAAKPDQLGDGPAIAISREQKTLTLAQAGTPVFTTYVALGRASLDTPAGDYQVLAAYPRDDMSSDRNADAAESYSLPNVPWALYFKEGGYAIHGTYWHDHFGSDQSQGCVNLTLSDAAYLYSQLSSSGPKGTPVVIVD
jgi:hypothetical protein